MLPNETPIVIAIAGPSGSGKTTLVQTVAAQLAPATQVYFDDYAASSAYPADLTSWLEGGADPNAWQTPQLAADLRTLRAGAAIVPPGTATPLAPAPYIVLEEPFGRERQEMAASIDYVVVIDIPLDLALARRLRRDLHWVRAQGRSESEWLEPVLEEYLAYGSTLYATVNRRAMASSDLVVDGQQPSVVQAQRVVEGVRTRFTG